VSVSKGRWELIGDGNQTFLKAGISEHKKGNIVGGEQKLSMGTSLATVRDDMRCRE